MAKKQRGLLSTVLLISVIVHVIIAVVFTLVKVAQALIEPEPDFVAVTPPTLDTQKKEKKVEASKRQRQSGGTPPKTVITSNAPSSFEVPTVDIKVSSPNGTLGGRGEGKGFGEGFGDGGGRGVGKNSGLFELTKFGATGGPGLIGYFYDLKQTKGGKPTEMAPNAGASTTLYMEVLRDFTKNWNTRLLEKYYRGKKPLFATQIYVTNGPSEDAAKAFGEEKNSSGYRWVVHYKGSAVAPKDGTFRFIGRGDNVMVVRLNEKIVLDGGFDSAYCVAEEVNTSKNVGPGGPKGWTLAAGAWFKVKEGDVLNLEVLIGDGGGLFSDYLLIEEKGEKFETRKDAPGFFAYPIFQLNPTPIPKEAGTNGNPLPASKQLVFPSQD